MAGSSRRVFERSLFAGTRAGTQRMMEWPRFVAPYGVNITGDNTYPHGSQLQLHCSSESGPQLEYSWSRTNTFSNDTATNTNNLTISNVTTLDGGNYTCTATNDAGSSSNTVTVYVGPVFTAHPIIQEEVINNSFTLQCTAEGFPTPSIQWYLSNTMITNSSNRYIVDTTSMNSITSILTVIMADFTDTGLYHCEAISSVFVDNVNSDMMNISVVVAPYGVNITGNNTYPHGSQIQLHCSSEGGLQLEYSWSRTNTFSNDTTTNTNNLTISNVATFDGGNYTCTITNDAGSSRNTVTVYVAPYSVNITGNNTYPHGSQLQLHCSSEGGPQLEYSWSRTNTFSNDTTTNTNNLTISNITTLDGGNYTCTVTNDAGSSSNTVTVYVGPGFTTHPMNQEEVINNSFTLQCTAEGFPTPSIQWYLNSTMITNSSNRYIVDTTSVNSITSILTVIMADFTDTGLYHCEAISSVFIDNVSSDMINISVVGECGLVRGQNTVCIYVWNTIE
ncbi:carcinoembryonic antigen-related cell adhesion molecule 5-like [Dysidea avara]|uniref:carcinoembryonic antigen-related cell adhesion molecule 5-like n=1 Tax=Dysidea avara TaxID=196820 RepID=UPI00331E2ADC